MEENRVEVGIREWRSHAKRLTDIFGDSITGNKDMAKAQLTHYREVLLRPIPGITNDEKVMRAVLRGEVKRMEKVLYPFLLVRIANGIGRMFSNHSQGVSKITAPAQLIVQPKRVAKRSGEPVRAVDKSQKTKHNLLPKKRQTNTKGIRR